MSLIANAGNDTVSAEAKWNASEPLESFYFCSANWQSDSENQEGTNQKRRSVIVFEARTKTVSRNEKLIFPIRNLENQQTDGEFHAGVSHFRKRRKKSDLFLQTDCTTLYVCAIS